MNHEPGRAVTLRADLTLEIDDQPVAITADGRDVTVEVTDLAGVFDAVATVPLPAGVRAVAARRLVRSLADGSAREGIRTRVVTPQGAVVTLGRDTRSSRTSRLLTGSDHLAIDVRALRPLWRPALRTAVRRLRARLRR